MFSIIPSASGGKYELPNLTYDYDALEPYIDAQTMEIHYTKHHQAYVDKLNAVLSKYPAMAKEPLESLLQNLEKLDMADADKITLKNNGGGHYNHAFFWEIMGPQKNTDQVLADELISAFGGKAEFKKLFTEAATTRFGSGWAWLARKPNGKLEVYSTANQDSPVMFGDEPIIGLDVWEHAYYLKYQNKRGEYIENWWNVLKIL